MDEKEKTIPDFGYVDFVGERPEGLPKPRIVRCGNKNRNHAPIKVNRTIRTGLKLTAPYEQVYVYISLENPSTGQVRTIDAKVDTPSIRISKTTLFFFGGTAGTGLSPRLFCTAIERR